MEATKLEQEFKYYIQYQDDFVKEYSGKFLVIRNQSFVGAFDTLDEAYFDSVKKFELGTFLLQKCTPGEEAYTQKFHGGRVRFI